MTRADLRARVYDKLGLDSAEQTNLGVDATINAYLNEAARYFCARAALSIGTGTITEVQNQAFYDLPSDCIRIVALYRDDPAEKVWPVDDHTLDAERQNWRDSSGTPARAYLPFGMDEMALNPIPSSSTETYTLYYVKDVGETDLSADTSTGTVPERYQDALVRYAAARYAMRFGRGRKIDRIARWMRGYLKQVRQAKRESQINVDMYHTVGPQHFVGGL